MADKVIVVEKRRGCGCFSSALVIILALVGFAVYMANESVPTGNSAGKRAADDPNAPRPYMEDLNGSAIISQHFKKGLRDYLLDPDSYTPHGSPRFCNHPKGRAYFQDFTAKNALGGPARQVAGLLYCTNRAETAWTFYSPETVSELLDECQIKGAK